MKLILKDKIKLGEWKIDTDDKLDTILDDIKIKYRGKK